MTYGIYAIKDAKTTFMPANVDYNDASAIRNFDAVDGYAITASFADCKNAAALHHVKRILLSSFANNTAKNSSGDILAIPPEQRDNNSGGSPYVP